MTSRRGVLTGLAAAAAGLTGIRSASAHTALVRSDPARRAVLTQPPSQIRLWFSEKMEAAYSSVSLVDAAGKPVATERAEVSPTDAKLLVLALPPLMPGEYTVRYRVNSIDGHMLEASYPFTLKGPMGGG